MLFPWVPGAQSTQSVDDVDFSVVEAVPLAHEVHVDWPAGSSAKVPAVQSEHEVAPFAPPVEVPMSQAVQASADASPSEARYVPATQSVHEARPSLPFHFPAAQGVQSSALS